METQVLNSNNTQFSSTKILFPNTTESDINFDFLYLSKENVEYLKTFEGLEPLSLPFSDRIEAIKNVDKVIKQNLINMNQSETDKLIEKTISYLEMEKNPVCFKNMISIFQHFENSEKMADVLQKLLSLINQENEEIRCEIFSFFYRITTNVINLPIFERIVKETLKLVNLINTSKFLVSVLKFLTLVCINQNVRIKIDPQVLINLLVTFFKDKDGRVRSCSLDSISLLCKSDIDVGWISAAYEQGVEMLEDDEEMVRLSSIEFVYFYSKTGLTTEYDSRGCFLSLCSVAICDPSYKVRCFALNYLSLFISLNNEDLMNSVSRKLYSSSNTKKSYHQRQKEIYEGLSEKMDMKVSRDEEEMQVQRRSPHGVFIDCLEEDHWQVRKAAVRALYKLCKNHINFSTFRESAMDLMIDSFSDSAHQVQTLAIKYLSKLVMKIRGTSLKSSDTSLLESENEDPNIVSYHFTISDNQLEPIIGALSDASNRIRHQIYSLISLTSFYSPISLHTVILCLFENLNKYPCDTPHLFSCLQKVSQTNANFVMSLLHNLIDFHPIIDLPEPHLTSTTHIAVLIIIYNSSIQFPSILCTLPSYFDDHLLYLKRSFPQYTQTTSNTEQKTLSLPPFNQFSEKLVQMFKVEFLNEINLNNLKDIDRILETISQFTLCNNLSILSVLKPVENVIKVCQRMITIKTRFNLTNTDFKMNESVVPWYLDIINDINNTLVYFQSLPLSHPSLLSLYQIQIISFCVILLSLSESSDESLYQGFIKTFHEFSLHYTSTHSCSILSSSSKSNSKQTLEDIFYFLSSKELHMDCASLIRSSRIIKAHLNVSAPRFDKNIKFHFSRQLSVDISIQISSVKNTDGLYLEVRLNHQESTYYNLSKVDHDTGKDSINFNFSMHLSFPPYSEYGSVFFKIIYKAFNPPIYNEFPTNFKSYFPKLQEYIPISDTFTLNCHPHS